MSILGAHMSIAGGYYKAAEAAHRLESECVQLFTKNNNQWRAKPISAADASRFRDAVAAANLTCAVSHNSYLINLASPDDELWEKSLASMVVEVQRAAQLGLPYVVAHPGAFTTSSEAEGLDRIVAALDKLHELTAEEQEQVQVLLETTAGQGSNLGWKFEHLGALLQGVRHPERLGVCFDTCHVFAAGYPLGTKKEYLATMRAFDAAVGLDQIRVFHVNDSKAKFGSRVDRHAHIGQGELGIEPFRFLLNDRRFRKVPMILETPKEDSRGTDMDAVNLATLRGLVPVAAR